MTTREITKQQFSDGTTIDSDRIDKMNSEVADYFNEISQRPITNKWVPTRYVWGYCPFDVTGEGVGAGNDPGPGAARPSYLGSGTYYTPFLPWMPVVNNRNTVQPRKSSSTNQTPTAEQITNTERYKGYLALDKDAAGAADYFSPIDNEKNQFSWEVGWATGKPQIIKEISVVFDKTENFPNSLVSSYPGWTRDQNWTTGSDSDIAPETPLSSVVIEILVISPTNPAKREEGFVVWSRTQMRLEGETFCGPDPNNPPLGAPAGFYYPNFGGNADGLWFRNEDANIPIPAGAQVVCAVILPDYQFVNDYFPPIPGIVINGAWWSPMTDTNQSYTMTITCLEETESYE